MSSIGYKLRFEIEKDRMTNEKSLEKVEETLKEKEEIVDSLSFFTKATNKLAMTNSESSKKRLPIEKLMQKLDIVDIEKLEIEVKNLRREKEGLETKLRSNRKTFNQKMIDLLSIRFKRVFVNYTIDKRGKVETVEMDAIDKKDALVLDVLWYGGSYGRLLLDGNECKERYENSFNHVHFINKLTYVEFIENCKLFVDALTDFVEGRKSNNHYYYEDDNGKKRLIELTQFKIRNIKETVAELSEEEYGEIVEEIYSDLQVYNRIAW